MAVPACRQSDFDCTNFFQRFLGTEILFFEKKSPSQQIRTHAPETDLSFPGCSARPSNFAPETSIQFRFPIFPDHNRRSSQVAILGYELPGVVKRDFAVLPTKDDHAA